MTIPWYRRVRSKLFAALVLLASATLIVCGGLVWLFDGFDPSFYRQVRRDFATFGTMVRLQEVATQVVQLSVSLSSADRHGQLAPVLDAITAGREKASYAVVVLNRDSLMTGQVDAIAAKLDSLFGELASVESLSAGRIAAAERRIAGINAVLPALDRVLGTAATVEAPIEVAELQRAAAVVAALLSEAGQAETVERTQALGTRFEAQVAILDRLAATEAGKPFEAAIKTLVGLGRGANSLFDLRIRELQAVERESQAMRPFRAKAAALSAEFGRNVEERRHALDEKMRTAAAQVETTRVLLIFIAVGSVVPCLALALLYVSRSVTGRLRRISAAMTALAGGNTEVEVPTDGARDEIGAMAESLQFFKRQTAAAQQLAQEVTDSIRRVTLAAGQATSAIGQVSDGANTQLTALRHVANGLQQSAEAITLVAANTHSARARAQQMADLVEHGRREMAGMVAAVDAIAKSSAHVSKFVDDIARIANQTNMLSLNAEIEAARAGEHGKGFTVVAEEVGKLADSSAQLATEIANRIRDAIQQAEHGVASATLVNDSIQSIAASVVESDRLAQSIAAAMEQQRTNVAEINGKMGELTGIGQVNASAATEISATMKDLSRLAEETREKVTQFNTMSGPPAVMTA